MFYNVFLALKLIKKKIKSQLILILQTVIALILIILFVGKLQYIYNNISTANTFNDQEAYYFMPYKYIDQFFNIKDELLKLYPELKIRSGEIGNYYFKDNQTKEFDTGLNAYAYSDEIINICNLPITEGIWFDEYINNTNYIPAIVVGNRYSVGDTVNLIKYPDNKEYTIEIIGKVKPESAVISFDMSGSIGASSIEYFLSKSQADLILPYHSSLYASIPESENESYREMEKSLASILFIDDCTMTPKSIVKILSNYGHSTYIKDMIKNYSENIRIELITYGIVCFVFTILTLVGIGGNNGIQNMLNHHQFVIYYILGASQKRIVYIELLRSSLIMLSSFILCIAIFQIFPVIYINDTYLISATTFMVAGVYLLFIHILTSTIFVYRLGKKI